jgi:tetratricopeptide (TPR) repeat protein
MGNPDEALERLSAAYAAVNDGADDDAVADLAQRLSSVLFVHGDRVKALELSDIALTIADGRRLGEILVSSLIIKAIALAELGRPAESNALLTYALKLATEQDLSAAAARALYNLADSAMAEGRFAEANELLDQGLELTRRRGDRQTERRLLAQGVLALVALGSWEEALARVSALREQGDDIWANQAVVAIPVVFAARGEVAALDELLNGFDEPSGWDAVDKAARIARGMMLREEGRPDEGAADAVAALHEVIEIGESSIPSQFAEAVDCAFAASRLELVSELLERVDALKPAQLLPLLDAEACRARAKRSVAGGDLETAEQWFRRAIDLFRELATPFHLARPLLEYAELLESLDRPVVEIARPLDEASAIFAELKAMPWLERASALGLRVAA